MKLLHARARLHSEEDALLLDDAQNRTNRLFMKLEQAETPSGRKAATRQIVFSADVKLAFSYLAATKKKSLRELTFDDVKSCAAALDMLSHNPEPVCCSARIVKQRHRTLMSFQHSKYTAQLIAGAILATAHKSLPCQYGRRGVNAALRAVDAQVAAGMKFGVEVDIRSFYPSVTLDGLAGLLSPLPRRVVENVVWTGPRTTFVGTSFWNDLVVRAQDLLPKELACLAQGSAASVSVGEIIVGRLIDALPDGMFALSYADNVILFGVSKNHLEQAIQIFVDRASDQPAGPLGVKVGAITNLDKEPFAFLGCVRPPTSSTSSGWAPKNYRLSEIDALLEKETLDLTTIRLLQDRLTNWLGQYQLWSERFDWIKRRLSTLVAYEGLHVNDPISRGLLARKWLELWEPDDDFLDVIEYGPPPSADTVLFDKRLLMIQAIIARSNRKNRR